MTTTHVPTFTVGEMFRKARQSAGMDQQAMAEALMIARNTVSGYETGRSVPPLDVAWSWAKVTGVTLDWLVSPWANNKTPDSVESGVDGDVRPKGFEPLAF